MTSQDVDNYKQIKSDLDQLRSIVEKSELWVYKRQGEDGIDGDGPLESDNKKKVQSMRTWKYRPRVKKKICTISLNLRILQPPIFPIEVSILPCHLNTLSHYLAGACLRC